jgi:branched-chain amino acid transport system ATP-binding protein
MLEVRDLVAGYRATQVLRGVSLDVAAGEIVAVLGANGVGKTTLNRAISGLIPITTGRIAVPGDLDRWECRPMVLWSAG